uniref:NADH-ubiquinone oxidoreductase chain 5 n=1 Tax=Spathius agrili TaxID=314331 RepID=D8KZU2_SPAAG|nr:NADH dehydrogenase subunit 5 [Spathius agrili]ACJ06261.1 NADH dehydrogenase subunit 5 [Spathius agrili]
MFLILSFYLFMLNSLSWIYGIMMLINKNQFMMEWMMYSNNSMKMIYLIYFDWMSLIFISTVTLISSMVILYSMNYMENDLNIKRFMLLIIIFVSSMILMIISPNMLSILLGWDGLGLSSYCLVAYYSSKKSFNSSMITILMNRFGDIMILILISLFMMYGSWNFLQFKFINNLFMFIIMLAGITKSAQIPFSSWLPMAMAAPTPISSLVHSSTLVTAGVYILIRFNYLMNYNFLYFLMMLSCLTMFMSGSSANMEYDLKKIIALSTLSQLGLMILTVSINLPKLAFFHLITHAMFKSLLFLCSGIIIHNYLNNQDIRLISMMYMNMPFINLTFNTASLTLCGMPFLTGFYSKDLIIEMFIMNNNNFLMFFMMFTSMSLTMSYTFRMMFYLNLKSLKSSLNNHYMSWNLMNYSIIILLMLSLFYGSILNWIFFSSLNQIYLPNNLKTIIYKFLLVGLLSGLMLSMIKIKSINLNKYLFFLYNFFSTMWYLPFLLKNNKNNLLNFNNNLLMFSDSKWLEFLTSQKIIMSINSIYKFKYLYNLNFMFTLSFMIYLIIMLLKLY